jgi:putative ATP-binding cassette transporter
METFTPSLDWGDELITSVLWVAKAWVIGAACMFVALALLGRFTTWGRQFWRVTGEYFKGRESMPVWFWLGVLLVSVMIDVRLSVLFSYQSNDQFSALQAAFEGEGAAKDSAIESSWWSILILVALAAVDIVRTVLDLYLMHRRKPAHRSLPIARA